MIKHIFTLLWNQKRRYVSILLEQSLVFIILIVCLTSLVGAIKLYNSPGLLDTKNTLMFGYMMHTSFTREDTQHMSQQMDVVIDNLRKKEYVVAVSQSSNFIPYLRPDENYGGDSIIISPEYKIYANIKGTDQSAVETFDIEMVDGRWFTDDEKPNGHSPAVVTSQFVEMANITGNPIGKTVQVPPHTFQIVGVIAGLKSSVFTDSKAAIVLPLSVTGSISFYKEYVARVKDGYEDEFYSDFYSELSRLSANANKFEPMISDLNRWRNTTMTDTVTQVAFIAIPTIFLLIFAFMGTMGLTLMNLKKDIPELAIRITIGSTNSKLIQLIITQNLLISLIAIIPGCLIALFVYEFSVTNFTTIALSVLLMVLFSILSSLYPAYTIARLSPVEALKYE